ncbi:MAG: DinB family protein [Pirellulales bacterium]|nr:DinB family protein [Pirellulales bacterium]
MSYADLILPEFEQEMASTRKVLERIPDDKFEWRCHAKSNTLGWNANHLAEIPGWVAGTLTGESWDVAPVGGEPYKSPNLKTTRDVLAMFDQNVTEAKAAIQAAKDEDIHKMWSLLQAGQPLFTMPRSAVIRSFVINHTIHHRAHVCVYLRLNDIPVPGLYGPSADDQG